VGSLRSNRGASTIPHLHLLDHDCIICFAAIDHLNIPNSALIQLDILLYSMAIYDQMPMDSAENVDNYTPGGLHPVIINQRLDSGRYKILHKLGSGGLSTVWLARDLQYDTQKSNIGPLVSLKVQRADESPDNANESPEVVIPRKLASLNPELRLQMAFPEHAFNERGPNGTHLCVVSELAGSNLLAISNCPGRIVGTRRLRGDIARRVSGQVANFVRNLHSAGFVHGGTIYNQDIYTYH
jgi:serine/threonine-protein kinase SRPK3